MRRLAVLLLLSFSLTAEPRRFIVEYREPPSALRLERDAGGLRVRHHFTRAFHGVAIELKPGQSIDAVAALPWVAAVHPDTAVEAFGGRAAGLTPSRPIHAASGGAGLVVAVIDSGIDYNHPALGGGLGPGRKVIGGYDFVNGDDDPMDDYRHGTHVAGIIAAAGGEVAGIAPNVRLLAYKVLDETGHGDTSDVIAAIERALDPNGDGDTSDHADIINLSLGGNGHPDDPASRAVDHAVAAGVVVCVAAGNTGEFHSIGSPAGAALAITVGASDGDSAIAEFSSRGPSTGNGAIKPDLVAPGVGIFSTVPGGQYAPLSGTSMATPYVAGLAALLREEHPDWTPARVKAALVATAAPFPSEETMTQGGGRVSPARAFASDLHVEPAQINFGLNGGTGPAWQASRTVMVRNESPAPRTLHSRIEGGSAAIAIAPIAGFTLAPGESREVVVSVAVDDTLLGRPPSRSLSFGGAVILEWDGGDVRIPWAFLRAARATVTYAGASPGVIWRIPATKYSSWARIGADGVETLMEPGTYELAVYAERDGDLRVIVPGERVVEADVRIDLSAADAPHEIRLDTFPAASSSATTLYSIQARLALRDVSVPLPLTQRVLHTSTFGDDAALLLTESYVDAPARTVHIAQHPPLRSVASDRIVRVVPGELTAQQVQIRLPASVTGTKHVQIMPRDWPRRVTEFAPQPESLTVSTQDDHWTMTLFMTPELHEDAGSGVQIAVRTGSESAGPIAMSTPVIRRNGNGFFATRAFEPQPQEVIGAGGTAPIVFGGTVVHGRASISVPASGLQGTFDLEGARGETRRAESGAMAWRVTDRASGAEVAAGALSAGSLFIPLPRRGAMRAEIRAKGWQLDGRIGDATLALEFDNSNGVATPPALTSLVVLDGAGRSATTLEKDGNGWLYFSAVDHDGLRGTPVVAAATEVFFRRRGTSAWVQLQPVATSEDREGTGTVFRAELRDALRVEGEIELAIEVADEEGSTTSWTVAPAFIVGPRDGSPRRRAVRH